MFFASEPLKEIKNEAPTMSQVEVSLLKGEDQVGYINKGFFKFCTEGKSKNIVVITSNVYNNECSLIVEAAAQLNHVQKGELMDKMQNDMHLLAIKRQIESMTGEKIF